MLAERGEIRCGQHVLLGAGVRAVVWVVVQALAFSACPSAAVGRGQASPTLRAGDWGLRAAKSAALRPQRLTPALGCLAVGRGEEHGRDVKRVEVEERWQMKLSW